MTMFGIITTLSQFVVKCPKVAGNQVRYLQLKALLFTLGVGYYNLTFLFSMSVSLSTGSTNPKQIRRLAND
jgi:hypothetical protein